MPTNAANQKKLDGPSILVLVGQEEKIVVIGLPVYQQQATDSSPTYRKIGPARKEYTSPAYTFGWSSYR
jgi:hypothetical protein